MRLNDLATVNALGLLLLEQGRPAEAVACFEQALRLRPDAAAVHVNLGLALLNLGRWDEAVLRCRRALDLQPGLAEAHNNLGLGLFNQGQAEEAICCFQEALRLRPNLVDAQNNLGLALAAQDRPDEALACYEQALQTAPDHVGALTNLGNACKEQGRVTAAIACYRRVLALRPQDARIHSNLLLALQYQPHTKPHELLAEAQRYAQQQAAPLAAGTPSRPVRPLDGRRLRIGYVSADFREHPVAYFLEPILAHHDHQRFEIFCYADVVHPDAVTQRFQGYAALWRSLVGLSDAQATEVICQDGIDILVDLAGHTGGNRLLVFARKPAPIQVSYLGYLGTTGLPAMDYYLTDDHADPPGVAEAFYQEQLLRLPECAFCYSPGDAPEVNRELPARQSGAFTFACLNSLSKLPEDVLTLWSSILAATPGTRLLLRRGAGWQAEEWVRAVLARRGIAPERLLLAGQAPTRFDYLKRYGAIDLCLDPFPYNGVTTTCDALWMGVPVVTLAGALGVARQGVRLLRSVGLEELIATTPEAYVRLATELAGDWARLTELRLGLRERMSRSPLRDGRRLTRSLETAFHQMWEQGTSRD